MRSERRSFCVVHRRPLALTCFAAALLSVALPAQAAQRFEVQRFHPRPNQNSGYLNVQGSELLAPGFFAGALLYNHGSHPLGFSNSAGNNLGQVVQSMGSADFLAAVGITRFLELGLDLPLVLYQSGEPLPTLVSAEDSDPGAGVGDLRLVPTLALPGWQIGEERHLGTAFTLAVALPTGERRGFQGGGLALEPRVAVEYLEPRFSVAVNAGYLVRDRAELLYLEVDDAFTWGVAGRVPLGQVVPLADLHLDGLEAIAEVDGELSVLAKSLEREEAPMEALVGLRAVVGRMAVDLAGGAGLLRGYGTPAWRLVAGVSFLAGEERDRDGDGIADSRDACPDAAEDPDLFHDHDGCPDLDNDEDGIVDLLDSCPMLAAQSNADGCPDGARLAAVRPGEKAGAGETSFAAAASNESCRASASGQVVCEGPTTLTDLVLYFGPDSAALLPESVAALREAVRRLATHPRVEHVWVEGHADDRDSHDYNLALSRKRAEEVKSQLVRAGIDPARLTTTGFSDAQHLANGQSELAQTLNKRVELRVAPRVDGR